MKGTQPPARYHKYQLNRELADEDVRGAAGIASVYRQRMQASRLGRGRQVVLSVKYRIGDYGPLLVIKTDIPSASDAILASLVANLQRRCGFSLRFLTTDSGVARSEPMPQSLFDLHALRRLSVPFWEPVNS